MPWPFEQRRRASVSPAGVAAQAIRDADEGSWVEERSTTMWYWHCGRRRESTTSGAAHLQATRTFNQPATPLSGNR